MTLPLFICPEAASTEPGSMVSVTGEEAHHAAVVRRVRVGEQIDLTDGRGALATIEVTEAQKDRVSGRVLLREDLAPETPRLLVVQAIPKGDRGELAVEMLTEVGADVIVPWAAERCVSVWRGERVEKSLRKWRNAAREAAKQSHRVWFPQVLPMATTEEVAGLLHEASVRVVLHESASGPLSDIPVPGRGEIVIVVGPEGGISDAELAAFSAVGAEPLHMGSSVLRTSTAGVAAAAALLARTPRWR
jgi:16S rRNA (uracil1498-N3)-methyltransferase